MSYAEIKENSPDGANGFIKSIYGEVFYLRLIFSIADNKEYMEGYKRDHGWIRLEQRDVDEMHKYIQPL